MKRAILIVIIALWGYSLQAQSFKVLPMKWDAPDTPHGDIFKYDKLDHLVGTALLTMAIPARKHNLDLWLPITANLLFEIKDGFQWRRSWGFSRTDLIAGIAGPIFGMWLKDCLYNRGICVVINKNGISLHF
jgi:hypothetical protein